MKRRREETSQSPARYRHGGISTGDINIPFDVTMEILKKLPVKSLLRFQCVSKQWSSTISGRRDFIDSIVTRSLNQPPRDAHIILDKVFIGHNVRVECLLVLSSSNSLTNSDKESLSIPQEIQQYVRGLILLWSDFFPHQAAIYNLTTRQLFHLPEIKFSPMAMTTCFFGYDPVENQYKVLFLGNDGTGMEQACQVFTLGDPTWRTIQGVGCHSPMQGAICINGVIYYQARTTRDETASPYKLMSFDVRSEEFCHVGAPHTLMDHFSFLIDYQGKLGFMYCEKGVMEIWVMEDGDEKTQRWSKIFFYEMDGFEIWRILGVTRGGEIVLAKWGYLCEHKLCVVYYDPKLNSMRLVDLESTYPKKTRRRKSMIIETLPDHVENTMRLY